ncbi:hypothetical protein H0H87_011454 [Tephrocybe sp. NHM501043]|nr:hypothetical protein H0H87_011454 [Tephrocybe sp. NHM501043]
MEGQYPNWWKGGKGETTPSGMTTPTPNMTQTKPVTNSAITAANNDDAGTRCLAFSTKIGKTDPDSLISYADSAASNHFFVDRADFESYSPVSQEENTGATADGGEFMIARTGHVRKWVTHEGEKIELTFENAKHTPNLSHNLISIG